jgi:predicted enzyme related to lactoylglutathione lyase
MADTSVIAPGVPSWVDLSTPDVEASKRFYSALFGWQADTMSDPGAGGYTMFRLGDKQVAGAGPAQDPQQPPAWTTYVSVEDADAVAARVGEAGGTVLMPPMDVMEAGRMAIFQDPTGAVIAVWQPRQHPGGEVFNVPGAVSWNELSTRDTAAAIDFYSRVFGWDHQTHGEGAEAYTEWKLGGRSIGGMMAMRPEVPAMVPAHWLVYFAVEDCDATVERTKELGGQVMVPPMDIPQGRFAVLADPQGATFAVIGLGQGQTQG